MEHNQEIKPTSCKLLFATNMIDRIKDSPYKDKAVELMLELLNKYDFQNHYIVSLPTFINHNNEPTDVLTQRFNSVDEFINLINEDVNSKFYLYTAMITPPIFSLPVNWRDAKQASDTIQAFTYPTCCDLDTLTPSKKIEVKISIEDTGYDAFMNAMSNIYYNYDKYLIPSTHGILIRYAKCKKEKQ